MSSLWSVSGESVLGNARKTVRSGILRKAFSNHDKLPWVVSRFHLRDEPQLNLSEFDPLSPDVALTEIADINNMGAKPLPGSRLS